MEHTKDNAKHIEKANFRAAITPAGFAMRYNLDESRKVQCFYTCADGEGVFYAGDEIVAKVVFIKKSWASPVTAYGVCRKMLNGVISRCGKRARLRANKKIDETREKTEWLKK